MQSFDNIYHVAIKTGQAAGSRVRKYSDAAVALLKKVRTGQPYEIPAQVLAAQPAKQVVAVLAPVALTPLPPLRAKKP